MKGSLLHQFVGERQRCLHILSGQIVLAQDIADAQAAGQAADNDRDRYAHTFDDGSAAADCGVDPVRESGFMAVSLRW